MATDLLSFTRDSDEVKNTLERDGVRAPALIPGQNYIERRWGKKITYSVVQYLGVGPSIDALLEKAPRIKDLNANGQNFLFFNVVNDAGEIETIALAKGEGDNDVIVRGGDRVTFKKVAGEVYPTPVVPAKPATAPAAAAAPKKEGAKRGRKPGKKATEAELAAAVAPAEGAVEEAPVPLADDVTDATAAHAGEGDQPETHGDDRAAA